MKFNLFDVYLKIILIFPILTLFQAKIANLNRAAFALLLFSQIYLLLFTEDGLRKINKRSLLIICSIIILGLSALIFTRGTLYALNDAFYFPFFMLYILIFVSRPILFNKYLNINTHYMKVVVAIWSLIVGISAFFPSSYVTIWGEGRYFQSLTDSPFRLAPTALFITVILLYLIIRERDPKLIIWSIIPLYCFYYSGSRTYFAIGILLFLILWRCTFTNKKLFLISLIPLFLMGSICFINSSVMDKMMSVRYTSTSHYDFWGTITNSRTVFWKSDIEEFLNRSWLNIMIGNGHNFIYEVNYKAVGTMIWAHNDFVQILTTYGIIGLILYCYAVYELVFEGLKNTKLSAILKIAVILIWFINAFFNMFYTYFCSLLSFPILVIALNSSNERSKEYFEIKGVK